MKTTSQLTISKIIPNWAMVGLTVVSLLNISVADSSDLELRKLQEKVTALSKENASLKDSLVRSNHNRDQLASKFADLKKRLGALGSSLLSDNQDKRILNALSEVEFLNKRLTVMEESTIELIDSYREFASSALVSDPDIRNELEASIRNAETALGHRHKPERPIESGTLQQAKIVSIDQESGLIVLNVGRNKDARIGMRFTIKRGSKDIATGIIAEARSSVSGLLVEKVLDKQLKIQNGDTAKVLLN